MNIKEVSVVRFKEKSTDYDVVAGPFDTIREANKAMRRIWQQASLDGGLDVTRYTLRVTTA